MRAVLAGTEPRPTKTIGHESAYVLNCRVGICAGDGFDSKTPNGRTMTPLVGLDQDLNKETIIGSSAQAGGLQNQN
jgi:hypothetical protein